MLNHIGPYFADFAPRPLVRTEIAFWLFHKYNGIPFCQTRNDLLGPLPNKIPAQMAEHKNLGCYGGEICRIHGVISFLRFGV